MSLYCFGKLLLLPSRHGFSFPDEITIGGICDEDVDDLRAIPALSGTGIYFSIHDDRLSHSATGLWTEAFELGASNALRSPFGRAIHRLLFDVRILAGGLALVDGGIETVWEGTPDECWTLFLDRIGKPWDTIDNPLLIWRQPDRVPNAMAE